MKYYIDCEFDGMGGPLLSMALVSETGKSLYAVMNFTAKEPWVLENVVPLMVDCPLNQIQFCRLGAEPSDLAHMLQSYFLSDADPYVVADWPDDITYLCQAMLTGPGTMINVPGMKFAIKRVDAYPTTLKGAVQHNAWWDAMALRALFVGPEYE
jgi:hypothetical protein